MQKKMKTTMCYQGFRVEGCKWGYRDCMGIHGECIRSIL